VPICLLDVAHERCREEALVVGLLQRDTGILLPANSRAAQLKTHRTVLKLVPLESGAQLQASAEHAG
jgi:hypothetical protein